MKKTTMLAALVLTASISSQAAQPATTKLGILNFALTDTYQYRVYQNNVLATNTVDSLKNCTANIKYTTGSSQINNASVITAIGKALGVSFTSKAQIAVVRYDNVIPAPPYPPYFHTNAAGLALPAVSYNGPRDAVGDLLPVSWPNEAQTDWVDYDPASALTTSTVDADVWPKAVVEVSDPNNATIALQCLDVSQFFSFEEAFCYFCWDTVDRVTSGTFKTGTSTSGDICIGSSTSCGTSGSGTTKWYMTIKFNNVLGKNGPLQVWDKAHGSLLKQVAAVDSLVFTVGGVVNYPWSIQPWGGVATAVGTMTMSQANGYAQNPWCGVLTGSVKITDTANTKDGKKYLLICYP